MQATSPTIFWQTAPMTSPALKYPAKPNLLKIAQLFEVDARTVCETAGVSPGFLTTNTNVDASEFYALLGALLTMSKMQPAEMALVKATRDIHFNSQHLALSCAPNVRIGLDRLSQIKPLLAPFALSLLETSNGLQVTVAPAHPDHPMPAALHRLELCFLIDMIRRGTGVKIVPTKASAANGGPAWLNDFVGVDVANGPLPSFVISHDQANLPMADQDPQGWQWLQQDYRQQLKHLTQAQAITDRVQTALVHLLIRGQPTLRDAAKHLGLSGRTLQRRLEEANSSFQNELTKARQSLAQSYVAIPDVNLEEIAFLLGYRRRNSFVRAYEAWFGETPAVTRHSLAP